VEIAADEMNVGLSSIFIQALKSLGAAVPEMTKPTRIYIMAGQSNMEGPGSTQKIPQEEQRLLAPRNDVWITWAGRTTGPLKPGYGPWGFGPELGSGHVLGNGLDTDAFIIKVAVGGTCQATDWRAPSSVKRAGGEVGYLYKRLIKRTHSLLAHFEEFYPPAKGRGYEVAALLWLQGESDACRPQYTAEYRQNFFEFIRDVREDLGIKKLPVIIAKINDSTQWDGSESPHAAKDKNGKPRGKPGGGRTIRAVQQEAADTLKNVVAFETKDLDPGYHYDTPSIIEIGRRFGKAAVRIKEVVADQNLATIARARQRFLERTYPAPIANRDTRSLDKGLIGYWKFDENGGRAVKDRSHKGYDGEAEGGPVWVKGLHGSALKLTGRQHVLVPAFEETLNPRGLIENLSISYWIITPIAQGLNRIGKGIGHPWDKRGPDWGKQWDLSPMANDAGWDMSNCDNSGLGHFTTFIDKTGARKAVAHPQVERMHGDGYEWHHLAGVYDGREGTMNVYVDGVLGKTQTTGLADNIMPAKTFLKFGGYLEHKSDFQVFDEVAIWDRPLTEAEVQTLYNNGGGVEISLER